MRYAPRFLAAGFVAAALYVGAGSLAGAAPPVAPASPNTSNAGCTPVTTTHFGQFAAAVWNPQRWRRGDPPRRTILAKHRLLGCAVKPDLARQVWHNEKHAYYRYRAQKLLWGNCSDSGPASDCIHGAAVTYGADEGWMVRVSLCESHWNRYAVNPSGASGFAQFMPSTWATTPYGGKSIWSIKWQSLAMAWMEVNGRSGEWVCQ